MRKVLLIIAATLLISCNPFISKDLRHKNKCNRQLERVTKRCPELLQQETIKDTVILQIPKVEIDTFIQLQTDTFKLDSVINLIKDTTTRKFIYNYIKTEVYPKDTIRQKIDGYTFSFWFVGSKMYYSVKKPLQVVKKINDVKVNKVVPIKLSIWEQILNGLSRFRWWILVLLGVILGFKILKKL